MTPEVLESLVKSYRKVNAELEDKERKLLDKRDNIEYYLKDTIVKESTKCKEIIRLIKT